jgi:hypothetical protein
MPRPAQVKKQFYAALVGRDGPGVYRDWPTCQAAVNGFPSKFKGFVTKDEAFEYMRSGGALRFPLFSVAKTPVDVVAALKIEQQVVLSAVALAPATVSTAGKRKRGDDETDIVASSSIPTESGARVTKKAMNKLERHKDEKIIAEKQIHAALADPRAIVATSDGRYVLIDADVILRNNKLTRMWVCSVLTCLS